MRDHIFISALLLFCLISPSEAYDLPIAKPGCTQACGYVEIPYPFGIGSECALNDAFTISCTGSALDDSLKPYLTKLNLEVLQIALWDQTVSVKTPVPQICDSLEENDIITWSSTNLEGTPLFFSQKHNKLMLFGCGNVLLKVKHGDQVLSGCVSLCRMSTNVTSCYGINCCQTDIAFDLTAYELDFTVTEMRPNTCASALLADKEWAPDYPFAQTAFASVPVVLDWIIPNSSVITSIPGCIPRERYLQLIESHIIVSYECDCQRGGQITRFNPYLDDACNYGKDYSNICGSFIPFQTVYTNHPLNTLAFCNCHFVLEAIYDSQESELKKHLTAIIVGVTVGAGVLLLTAVLIFLYKLVKKRREKISRHKFFKRNGGLLLQQQLSGAEGVIDRTIVFTAKELNKASDGFHENRVLGQGGQGTVYKGMLTDGRLVAIKKAKRVTDSQLKQFINEVVVLSQVNHRNVVKLLGCCLETEVPILVYELVPNGTLFDLIHNQTDEFPLTWNLRLRIATEIAGALAYLHSAVAIPIFHRDIKSSNILLDEKYIAKVSDFGTSRSVEIEKTHITTLVRGTFGYLDPEYFQSSQFTEKSDVYSFGVVMVELLTRKKPISSTESEEDSHLSLATRFLTSADANCLDTILDPEVMDQSNKEEMYAVSKLAQRCLNLERKKRPTMKEVATELESIKISKGHPTVHKKIESSRNIVSEILEDSDTNDSWTAESDQEVGPSSDI